MTNSYFEDGDNVWGLCKVFGRGVLSHPEDGETSAFSEYWIEIDFRNPVQQYASATYIEARDKILNGLDTC